MTLLNPPACRHDEPPVALTCNEPRTLMPWEIDVLRTFVPTLMAEVLAHMRNMDRQGRSSAEVQSAAERVVLQLWSAEQSTRGDMVRTLSSYGNTHFNLDEDDRYDD